MSRGLTLIEMLAAVVLLTLLAATAVPVLRGVRHSMRTAEPVDLVAVARIADESIAEVSSLIEGETMPIESGDGPPVTASIAYSGDDGSTWIAFTSGNVMVFRWDKRSEDR